MSLESTNIYKLFETTKTQIMRFSVVNAPVPHNNQATEGVINVECQRCKSKFDVQVRFSNAIKPDVNKYQYPKNDIFICSNCGFNINLAPARMQMESQLGKRIIL
jgi:hypothetical protein